jgi:hypothetical protein
MFSRVSEVDDELGQRGELDVRGLLLDRHLLPGGMHVPRQEKNEEMVKQTQPKGGSLSKRQEGSVRVFTLEGTAKHGIEIGSLLDGRWQKILEVWQRTQPLAPRR